MIHISCKFFINHNYTGIDITNLPTEGFASSAFQPFYYSYAQNGMIDCLLLPKFVAYL